MEEQYGRAHVTYYDLFEIGVKGDVEFYVEEAKKAGPPILELGCGNGRILIPIAQAGIRVTGLDCAPAMLSAIRERVTALDEETRGRIEIIEGDMREFSLGREFNLIAVPYRAFQHLLTPEDQRKALECMRRHLTDDGRLILNIFDPRLDMLCRTSSELCKHTDILRPDGSRFMFWSSVRYDMDRQVLEETCVFEEVNNQGEVVAKRYSPLVLKWTYHHEMEYLLRLCGFEIEALYSDFQRGPYQYGKEQIWVARLA